MTFRRLRDVELVPSAGFAAWLSAHGSIAMVRAGQLVLVGLDADGDVCLDRSSQRLPTAVARRARAGLWLAADRVLWRFDDAMVAGGCPDGLDRVGYEEVLLPQAAWVTGYLGVLDLAVGDGDGNGDGDRPLLVSSRLSAVVSLRPNGDLEVVWRPPWISAIVAEDRCLLNGLAVRNGTPAFVTSGSTRDTRNGWLPDRKDGGVVVDAESGEVVVSGLSLPHAPRLVGGRLWIVETGSGSVGVVDPAAGTFEAVVRLPAYVRSASVVADRYLVLGGSSRRDDAAWRDLPLGEHLSDAGITRPAMGLFVVDTEAGELVEELVLEGTPRELYSTCWLPGVRRAMAIDPDSDDAQELVVYAEA
jgi:uncharacterized protein (TIGR03032 family)